MKEDSKLIAVHEGKYYKRGDGLAIGPGCFTRGLEYSTGKTATVIGKPNPYFFNSAIPNGIAPHECCMIGDVSSILSFFNFFSKVQCGTHMMSAYVYKNNISSLICTSSK